MSQKSLVIGASAGLGRAISEKLAAKGHALYLLASHEEDLLPLVKDLTLRFGVPVYIKAADLRQVDTAGLHKDVHQKLGGMDNLFFIAGYSDLEKDKGRIDEKFLTQLIEVNFLSACRIVNAFLDDLATNPRSNLIGIGSVAGVRGRQKNMVYSATKRGMETYFETCRHWLAHRKGGLVQFYRLGILNTSMAQPGGPLPMGDPQKVAGKIVNNLGRDMGTVYLPGWWWVVMMIIQYLPWKIFKRLDI